MGCAPAWPTPSSDWTSVGETLNLSEAFQLIAPMSHEASVAHLSRNEHAWAARWDLIERARERIDVTYFIIDKDVFGLSFLGALLHKAQQGVRVRLLIDARGSLEFTWSQEGRSWLEALAAMPTAEVRIYNPPIERAAESLMRFSLEPMLASNHDKIILVDGKEAIIGGRNLGRAYFSSIHDDESAILDHDIWLQSEGAAQALEDAFRREFSLRRNRVVIARREIHIRQQQLNGFYTLMDDWLRRDGTSLLPPDTENSRRSIRQGSPGEKRFQEWSRPRFGLPPPHLERHLNILAHQKGIRSLLPLESLQRYECDLHVVDTHAKLSPRTDRITSVLLRLVRAARDTVMIETPYLILDQPVLDVLSEASRRGVRILFLTNSPDSSDNIFTQAIFWNRWPAILEIGEMIQIFVVDDKHLLHSKKVTIDDSVTVVGTYNFDPLSRDINSEVVAIIWSRQFNEESRARFRALLGLRHTHEYQLLRAHDGKVVRYPASHSRAGAPIILTGPHAFCHTEKCAQTRRLAAWTKLIDPKTLLYTIGHSAP